MNQLIKWLICSVCVFLIIPSLYSQECVGDRYLKKVFKDVQYTNGVIFADRKTNPFGRSFEMKTDVYEPKGDTVSKRPFIVLIHGGAHRDIPFLNRQSPDIGTLAMDLARRGYVVFSPEYRLVNMLRFDVAKGDNVYTRELFHSLLDIDDLFCFLSESYANGNPYRIDIEKVFMGGVSSGAIITTHALLMKDTLDLNDKLRKYARKVSEFDGRELQDFLQNKFCGINILGALCYSTTLLDTQLVRNTPTAWYFTHSINDFTTPYNSGYFLGSSSFGITYGPGSFMDKMKSLDTRVKADIWDNNKHPAFLKVDFSDPLSILGIIGEIKIPNSFEEEGFRKLLFETNILDATLDSTARFCYDLMDCSETVPTAVRNIQVKELKVYPNPVHNGMLYLELPNLSGEAQLLITDLSGRTVKRAIISAQGSQSFDIGHLPDGMYLLQLQAQLADVLYRAKMQVYKN